MHAFTRFSRTTQRVASFAAAAVVSSLAWAGAASAAEPTSPSVYFEAGLARHGEGNTNTGTIGLRLPMQSTFWGGSLTGAWDLYLSEWDGQAATPGARTHYTQIGLVPMFRHRFDGGQSPWFVEGGIGVSYLNAEYEIPHRDFSTRWNFSDHIGVGRNFGASNQHELGLYVKHVSNAGIKKPNPGETFLQLRYGYHF